MVEMSRSLLFHDALRLPETYNVPYIQESNGLAGLRLSKLALIESWM